MPMNFMERRQSRQSKEATTGIIESISNGETVFYYSSFRGCKNFKSEISRKVSGLNVEWIKNKAGQNIGLQLKKI